MGALRYIPARSGCVGVFEAHLYRAAALWVQLCSPAALGELCGTLRRSAAALWELRGTPSQYSGFVGTPFSTAALRELCCTPFLCSGFVGAALQCIGFVGALWELCGSFVRTLW